MKRSAMIAAAAAALASGAAGVVSMGRPECVMRVLAGAPDGCMRRVGAFNLPPKFGEPFPASEARGRECIPVACVAVRP